MELLGFELPQKKLAPYQSLIVTSSVDKLLDDFEIEVPDELAMKFIAHQKNTP